MKFDNNKSRINISRAATKRRYPLAMLLLLSSTMVAAATFNQTDWSGGATANTAVDSTNQTGWTEFSSSDAGVNNGTELTISPTANTTTHTRTDSAEFGSATNFQTHTDHADFSDAGALLSNVQVNNGAVGIKPSALVSAWADKAGTDWDVTLIQNGANAAFADLDGDGDLDMMASSTQHVFGYRNTGTDNAPVWSLVSGWGIGGADLGWVNPLSIAVGDLDQDGDYDLVLSWGDKAAHAFENTGDSTDPTWTYNSAWDIASGATATVLYKITLGDLNGDNVPELILGGDYSAGDMDVYEFDGTTPWVLQSTWTPPDGIHGAPKAAVGDLDGDGDPDLTVGWRAQTNLQLITNDVASYPGDPTNWTDEGLTGPAWGSTYDYPALADLDSDGDLDLMIGGDGTATVTFYENSSTTYNTSGTYTSAVIDTGSGNVGYTTLDYNIVTPTGTTLTIDVRSGPTASPDASWTDWADHSNVANGGDISTMGSGRYVQYRANMSTTDTSVTPLLMDITINYTAYPLANSVNYKGNKLRLSIASQTISWAANSAWDLTGNGKTPQTPAVADLNADGVVDVVRGGGYSNKAFGARGTVSPVWTDDSAYDLPFTDHLSAPINYNPGIPRFGDLDGDGDLDALVMYGNGTATVHAYENQDASLGAGPPVWAHNSAWELDGPTAGSAPALADLDNDGDVDLMIANRNAGTVIAYINDSVGAGPVWTRKSSWDMTTNLAYGPTPELADIDGDGDFDLLVGNANVFMVENIGTIYSPSWARNSGWDVASGGDAYPAAADLDDDGDTDVFVGVGATVYGYENTANTIYAASGVFFSAIMDFGEATFTTLDYSANVRTGTSVTVSVRAGNTSTPSGVWTGWSVVANGGSLAAYNGYRYMQYKVEMTANGANSLSPEVADVSINYTSLPSPVELISSSYDSGNTPNNYLTSLSWNETLVTNSDVRIQLRSSPDNSIWSSWMGPDGTSGTYWNSADIHGGGCSGSGTITCSTMASALKDGTDDRYFQYKVTLIANGPNTPTFSDVTVEYVAVLPPGITLSQTTGLATTEGLATDTFDVVLDAAPTDTVTVDLSSSDTGEAAPTVASLTFTTGNWDTPQTVTVTGVDDDIDDDDIGFTIYANPSSVGDANYDALATLTVTGTNSDDDTAGVTVTPTSGLAVSETGPSNDTFTVVLDSEPLSEVTINLSSSDATEGSVSPTSLTFTSGDWGSAKTVTVTGVDESIDDGDVAFNIVTSTAASADSTYHGMVVDDVGVTNADDDTVAINVNPLTTLTTTEAGGTDSFTIVLASEPSSTVTITLSSSNTSEGIVTPSIISFDSNSWSTPQTITVRGNDDSVDDGDIYYTIFIADASSADSAYDAYDLPDITAVNTDNETPSIVATPSSGLATSEAGDSASFYVSLGSQPSATVTLNVSSNDTSEGMATPTTLTFDSSDWDVNQLVTVSGVDDLTGDGDIVYTVAVAPDVSGDPVYTALPATNVSLTNTDDDGAGATDSGFSQTNWYEGISTNSATCAQTNGVWVANQCTAADPDNQAGWQRYYSIDAGLEVINSGADLRTATETKTLTQSSNADFAVGDNSQTFSTYDEFVGGTPSAGAQLNNGTIGLAAASMSASWSANAGWDHTLPESGANASFADMDGDGDMDMVSSSSGNVYGYRNTGTDDAPVWSAATSWNISATELGYTNPLITALGDLDQDGDYDLVLSYNHSSVNGYGAWVFENTGDAGEPSWTRNSSWDLAAGTTAGKPYKAALGDLNGDSVPELIVGGNYSNGQMDVYEFDGTTPWVYQSSWEPPSAYAQAGPKASVGDLDGDGDPDLAVGWNNRDQLQLITNTAGFGNPPAWSDGGFTGASLSNGSQYDYPGLVDLDGDGDLDLLIGESGSANLYGYENTGTTYNGSGTYTSDAIDTGSHDGFSTLDYTKVTPTNTTLTVDVRAADSSDFVTNSTGWVTDITNGGDISALGTRRYFQYRINLSTTDTAVTPLLTELTVNYVVYPITDKIVAVNDALTLEILSRTVVWTAETAWDSDVSSGSPDGNNAGPSPVLGDIDGDGDLDQLRGDSYSSQYLGFYENDGNNNWTYRPDWNLYCCSGVGSTRPRLADMDNDGDLDVLLGSTSSSTVWAFENQGDSSGPVWASGAPAPQREAWNIVKGGSGSTSVDLADLDGDGDLDALVGDYAGANVVWGFENIGTRANPVWHANSAWNLYESQCSGCNWYPAPSFADIDGDGDYDVILAPNSGDLKPYAYENVGDSTKPIWNRKAAWDPVNTGSRAHYELVDLDDDGDVDLLHATTGANVAGYRNTGVTTYAASGTYMSEVLDFGGHLGFSTVDYTATVRTGTTLTVELRSGNTATPDGTWSSWQSVADGADISAYGTNRYLQYRVSMTADGGNTTAPSLYDISFNYTGVTTEGSLVSNAYDTAAATSLITQLVLNETLVGGADVRVQLRAAPDNAGAPGTWTDWLGPDGTADSYWNSGNTYAGGCSGSGAVTCTTIPPILRNGADNQWLQYKVTLISDGANATVLSDIAVGYATGSDGSAVITVNPTSLTTTEDAGVTPSDTFDITLTGSPTDPVEIQLGSGDLSEGTVSPASLTFSSGDMGPKTVTVTAVDDAVRDGDVSYKVYTSATISADTSFNNLVGADVTVSNTDDDLSAGGVSVTPTSGLTTTESGGSDTFDVVLTTAPTADVTITVDSSDTTEGTVSPALLTFTSANWNTPQTVTVTGQDDIVFDQAVAYTVVTSVAVSADLDYDGVAVDDVSVTNSDDESAEVTITPDDAVNGLTVNEGGGAASFTFQLASKPAADVRFTLSSSDMSEATIFPFMEVVFTPSDWDVPQLGVVYGVNDDIIDGDVNFKIVTSTFSSPDSNFNGVNPPDIDATNEDDDGVYDITVSPATTLTTSEDGVYTYFNLRLASKPTADVIINLTSSDPAEGVVKERVVFTPDSIGWRGTAVRVTGVDDQVIDADQPYTIITSAAVSADPNYDGIDPPDVSVINLNTNTKPIALGQNGANVGRSVAYADVDGDGYDDAVIGAPNYDGTYSNGGQVFVYPGSAGAYISSASWSDEGDQVDAFFGQSVANAGDVNKDGYDDIIVGAYGRDIGVADEGRAYIYHGSASGLSATPDQTLSGTAAGGFFGYSVAGAGDVNKDGYDDVIVGAYGEDKAYVYHGSASGVSATAAQTLVGDQAGSQFAIAVAGAGDVDGDGYDDVIVGADSYDNGETDEGRVFVYLGGATTVSATSAWSQESDQASAYFGHAVAGIGDVNSDGYSDVLIGAYAYDNGHTDEGRVFGYYGSASGLSASVNIVMESNQDGANYGYSVAGVGDVNDDGYDDVIVGAPAYDNGEADEGYAIVYYGSDVGINSTAELEMESDQAGANFGVAVAGGGYFDGDGHADLLVGADLYDGSQTDEGRTYVYRTPPQGYGITVTPTSGLEVNEGGSMTPYTVVLDSPPTTDVVVESFSGDTSEGVIGNALLTFTPENWNVPQTVNVAGRDDAVDDGDVFFDVTILARSADANYDGIAIDSVSAVNRNDDYSVNVTASDANIGEQGPNTGTFTFSRTGDLSSDQLVTYSVGGTATNSSDYNSLSGVATIPAGQSSVDVVVTPVDDAAVDSGETVSVTVVSSGGYLVGASDTAVMTIVDNDAAGITVSPVSGLVTNEASGSATFTVVLNTQPSVDVTIALSSDDTAEGVVQPSSLTFTNGNWNTPQTVTVVGVDDAVIDGDVPYNIVTGAATSGDPDYSGMAVADVAVINSDDDTLSAVSIAATTAGLVESGSSNGIFTITRTGSTASDLTVHYAVSGTATSDTDYYSIGAAAVIPAGSSSVEVSVVPQDDADLEGDETVIVTLAADSSYVVSQSDVATVTIYDDDQPDLPVANFALDQAAGDGTTVTVGVYLDKVTDTNITYPVTIPYTISGTAANPADHDVADGNIVIASGKSATTTFNIVDDGLGDPDETVIFTMGSPTNAQAGAKTTHTVTIVEDNKAPKVMLAVTQGASNINLIDSTAGDVTVTATVEDPNAVDSHTYDWSLSNNNLVDIPDGDPGTFVFSSSALLDGFYKVRLTVTDDGTPAEATSVDLLLQVKAEVPTLTSADTDQDGIPDVDEAFYDADADGIPDYMDDDSLAGHELQIDSARQDYIMRTDPGLTLRLGDTAFAAGSDGALVTVDDIAAYGGGEGDAGTASAEDSVVNNGGYFDFEIINLPQPGQTARIVIPRLDPIPSGAVYRKYDPSSGWSDFVEDANNLVASAPGLPGECPLPGDAAYSAGLSEGYYCIQLTIEDGGANDQDGVANHVIEDPAQIGAVQVASVQDPAPATGGGGSGGGVFSLQWLVMLAFYLLARRRRYCI